MLINVNGTDIFYKRHLGSKTVLLLHGWGATHKLMDNVFDFLSSFGMDVVSVDLPGFGLSPKPPNHFGVDDYAKCISQLISNLSLQDIVVLGHSFGGRIAVLLAKNENVKALILTSAAGVKPKFSLKKKISIMKYKKAKKKGKDLSQYGSSDYKSLDPEFRHVFLKVVNRHLNNEIKQINIPTLLVWGKQDKETPLYMAKRFKKSIKDSALILLNGSHFAYLENNQQFCQIVKSFVLNV